MLLEKKTKKQNAGKRQLIPHPENGFKHGLRLEVVKRASIN